MNSKSLREDSIYSGRVACVVVLMLATGMELRGLPTDGTKRLFTVADDLGLAHFGDPYLLKADPITFSPDGRYFVVDTERGLLERDRPESTLRVYRTEDVRQLLLHSDAPLEVSPIWIVRMSTYKDGSIITNIHWLSDSIELAFLVKTQTGNEQLFLGDINKRTVHPLTPADQHVTGFDIRDREHVVYTTLSPTIRQRAVAESQAARIVGTGRNLNSLLFPENLYPSMSRSHDLSELWAIVRGRRFRVEDKSSGRPIHLYYRGQQALALSPDGLSVVTALAVKEVPQDWERLYAPSPQSNIFRIKAGRQDLTAFDGYRYLSEYVLIDLFSGAVKQLTGAPIGFSLGWFSSSVGAGWSGDGRSVFLSNTFLPRNAQDSEQQPGRPCIALVDLVKYRVTCLERLKGPAKTKGDYEDGFHSIQNVRFTGSDRVTVEYYGLDGSKGTTSYISLDDGSWRVAAMESGWSSLQEREVGVDIRESFDKPPVLVATDKIRKTSRVILDPNPQLKNIDLGEASIFKWKDKNDREWAGGLYKPPNFLQGKRYPLVVQTHGFFPSIFHANGIFPTAFAARALSASGIFVLQVPDCPLSVTIEEGPCNVAGYEAAIQQLVVDGVVDPDRVGIIGFSRSCYYVLDMLTMSTLRIRAASITDGVNEGYLQYITSVDRSQNSIAHEADAMNGAPPFGEGLQSWFNRAPSFRMNKVTTPLQVVALGRSDVLFMWEPYAVLRYLNKPVDLIVLREGTHVLTNPAERIASQGGTVDWFRFWLKGEEDPDPAKTEQYDRWRELSQLQKENEKAPIQSISP